MQWISSHRRRLNKLTEAAPDPLSQLQPQKRHFGMRLIRENTRLSRARLSQEVDQGLIGGDERKSNETPIGREIPC